MVRNRKRGFTLMETLIVIAVIGILAAITIPLVNNAIDESQRKACVSGRHVLESNAEAAAMTLSTGAAKTLIATRLGAYKGVHKDLCPAGGNIRMLKRGDGSAFLYCDLHDDGTSLDILNRLPDDLGGEILGTELGPNKKGNVTFNLIDYFLLGLNAALHENGDLYFNTGSAKYRTLDSTGFNFGNVSKEHIMDALGLPDINFDYNITYSHDPVLGNVFEFLIFDLLEDHNVGETIGATKFLYTYDSAGKTLDLVNTQTGTAPVGEKYVQDIHRGNKSFPIKCLDPVTFIPDTPEN